ncbi:MAG: autotransporter-associated beta strand repeat-containing protein [Kiritimatiellae bacterium]|nr:autotransporter-associated beta strand repeat-containing protein [Kiritimatiellia bacterium]
MKSRTVGVKAGLAVGLVSMLAMVAHAAEIQKADNTDALALDSSWVSGVAPGADDTALFDGEATPTATNWVYGLGGDVVWGGIRVTNRVGDMSVTNDGSRLSLGAGGMDLAIEKVDGKGQTSFDVPITLTASQTWLAPGGGSYFWRPVEGTGPLTLQSGWFAFYDPLTMSGGMNVAAGVHVRSNAVVSGAVSVSSGGMLLVNKPVATAWRQSFASGSVTNDGTFVFGRVSGSPEIAQSTVSLKTGDRLARAVATGDRNRGRVNIRENDVRMEGGAIAANWWYLYSGSYTQTQGSAFSDYAMYVGFGSDGPAAARTVTVEGGMLDVRRFHVGLASPESQPGVLEVRGGEVQVVRASGQYGGIDLAAVKTDGEGITATTAAAELNVSGGSLRTAQISFGSTDAVRDRAWNVTNGYARFTLSGGEVTVGSSGIGPHAVWNRVSGIPQECATAWYETLFSGGTLGAYASTVNRADTRLSDAHGGVTFRAADTDGTPYTITQLGALYGSGGLRKTGAGTLVLANAVNSYTGKTVVAEGTLEIDVNPGVMTARWTADTLAVSPGGTVTEWPCALGESYWNFTHALAVAIRSTATAPILAPETMNGHKAVRFNGGTDALGMSGILATTPVGGASRLTVAAVVRPRGPGQGDGSQITNAAGIVGSQMAGSGAGLWALAVNQNGAVGSGVTPSTEAAWTAVWDGTTNVVDNQPHVMIYTWTRGAELTVNVDGARTRLTDAVPGNVLAQTRILMGSNENGLGFDGDIAEIRFYKNAALSDAEQDELGALLAETYGATYTASGGGVPALIPDSPAVWSPDTLTGAPGAELTDWPSTNGVWKFSASLATAIGNNQNPPRTFDAPTIGTTLMNGYRVASFNGITDAMAITGVQTTPTSGATNLTVAVVMRSEGVGVGGYANDWRSGTAGIIGQVYDANWWGIAYNAYGRAGACIGSGGNFLNAWGAPRNLNDGEPHVLIYVWQNGSNVTMNVDGWRSVKYDTAQVHTAARARTRCMLGATERTCARVDIAEIHHYQTAFTPEQQNALGLALARKYGAETYGYLRDPGSGAPVLASRVVQIDAGATFKTASGGTRIEPEQCFTGAGAVTGTLVVGADGVIATATDAALTVENLTFEAGGVCRWAYGADGSHTPLAVSGTLSLPADTVVIEIDSAVANPAAYGVVMTWSGLLDDHGAVWEVRGGRTQTTVIVDTEAKQIRLTTPIGTLLSIR